MFIGKFFKHISRHLFAYATPSGLNRCYFLQDLQCHDTLLLYKTSACNSTCAHPQFDSF